MPASLVVPIAYGSVPAGRDNSSHVRRTIVVGSLLLVLAGCVALLAISQPVNRSYPTMLPLSLAESSMDEGKMATDAAQAQFLGAAAEIFHFLNISNESQTDLMGACQDMMLPCVATVGKCLQGGIDAESHAVSPAACQCYSQGFTHPIAFQNASGVQPTCSYICLDEISQVFQDSLASVNKDSAGAISCRRTLSHLAKQTFGSDDGVFVLDDDADAMRTEPVGAARVRRAAAAMQEHINLIRRQECADKPEFENAPSVLYDERGMAEGALGQYRLEVELQMGAAASDDAAAAAAAAAANNNNNNNNKHKHAQIFTGRVVHLPRGAQTVEDIAHDGDPANLIGRFRVMHLSPDPCASADQAVLAVTQHRVQKLNEQSLKWTAAFKPHHEGLTRDQFGMGFKPMLAHEQRAKTLQLADGIDAWTPPAAYDARDTRAGQPPCRAFEILDQGPCGSCYAFAAASSLSARMCRATRGKWNVVLSPQEMMDCDNACDGGHAYYIFKRVASEGGFAVEDFCDPYTAEKGVCTGTCEVGHEFYGLDDTAWFVGGNSPQGVKAMQMELLMHGPGVVGFWIYDDFMAYSGGVYHKSENATKLGAHATALIGWGTEDGVDYWLLQNSWGEQNGIEGIWKMRRGTDECNLESWGLTIVTPEQPLACPNSACANGGVPLRDCSCRCNGGWTGAACESCDLQCYNGGVRAEDCSRCWCPPGAFGSDCSGLVTLSAQAMCTVAFPGETLSAQLNYLENGQSKPPTQRSIIAFYALDATQAIAQMVSWVYVCGETHDFAINGGLCPRSLQIPLNKPQNPGTYKAALIEYIPETEFGQSGYPREIRASAVFARFTVTADCASAAIATAAHANDLVAEFAASMQGRAEAENAAREAMDARIKAADDARTVLVPDPSLEIVGLDPSDPWVWATGGPLEACWDLPGVSNKNPKHLVLFKGGAGSASYYATGLIGAGPDKTVAESDQGCAALEFAYALPTGEYTIAMADSALAKIVFVTTKLGSATVNVLSYSTLGAAKLTLHIGWEVPAERASVEDKIVLRDARNKVAAWFYTSCKCTGPAGASAVASGFHAVELEKTADTAAGGYTLKLYPGGGDLIAAVASDWVPWTDLGW